MDKWITTILQALLALSFAILMAKGAGAANLSTGTCEAMEAAAGATLSAKYLGVTKRDTRRLLMEAMGEHRDNELTYMVNQVLDNAWTKDVSTHTKRILAEVKMKRAVREFCK